MPFNVNNVDVTVCANAIYGITSAVLFNTSSFAPAFDASADMQQVYLNSSRLIAWSIANNYSSRPDLAQVYYPSVYNFLWYASRTLFLIESQQRYRSLANETIEPSILTVKAYLQEAFEMHATSFLLAQRVNETTSSGSLRYYFHDFLGLNDTNILGKRIKNEDDALFSTAQAINTLICTWTSQNPSTKRLEWKSNVPAKVIQLVSSSVDWLVDNIFRNHKYKPLNAFFSGSVKSTETFPFFYPANYGQFFNGTTVTDVDNVSLFSDIFQLIRGVNGAIDKQEFEELIKKKHFGFDTVVDFQGYNSVDMPFTFWSSEPYTYAVALLAISQFNNLEQ